jgi:23S rRNA pseudouridine2604 synthase
VGYGEGAQSVLDLLNAQNLAPEDRSGRHFVKADLRGLEVFLPLQAQASGLLVLTQEYGIARKLTADAARIEQEYVVEVEGDLSDEGLKQLNHGLVWQGAPLSAAKVSWQSESRLRFALKNASADTVVIDMCRQVGLNVLSLKRLRIGRLSMAGLAAGQWRYLLGYERF